MGLLENNQHFVFKKDEHKINRNQFERQLSGLARKLPNTDYIVNACEDKYLFILTFFATIYSRRCNILLPVKNEDKIQLAIERYKSVGVVSDRDFNLTDSDISLLSITDTNLDEEEFVGRTIPTNQNSAIVFTSGSTGMSKAVTKTWYDLISASKNHKSYVYADENKLYSIISTVPIDHMYGLEWITMQMLNENVTFHCKRTFYPLDILSTLRIANRPSVLVSTPMHLKTILEAHSISGEKEKIIIDKVLCATSPLESHLAKAVEQTFNSKVFEIYGCSEIGSIAYRYTGESLYWSKFPWMQFGKINNEQSVHSKLNNKSVILPDNIKAIDHERFKLIGRKEDTIKIGGKRESIAAISSLINSVQGVSDAHVYFKQDNTMKGGKIRVLAVCESDVMSAIQSVLKRNLDSVFIPRNIDRVDHIPRSENGKVSLEALNRLETALARNKIGLA